MVMPLLFVTVTFASVFALPGTVIVILPLELTPEDELISVGDYILSGGEACARTTQSLRFGL